MKLIFCSLLVSGFLFPSSLFAEDLSSTNYKILQPHLTGGMASASSTNYRADEGAIEPFTKVTATSTNYSLEGKFGIDGAFSVPVINSVTPDNLSRNYTDESPSFTVSAVSPDSQTLNYEARQDGTLKDGPQSTNVLTWALSGSDKGRRALKLTVSDPTGAAVKEQSMYAYRRPVK